ncbi:MAG: radical SAM protein, partial [Proteobacteria bacterium]|nr:radical SAM protein [Pseudomonadota bacterium]
MPLEGISWLKREQVLTFEEIARIVGVLARLGIRHVRLTGGEPLSRQGVEDLVEQISGLPGIEEVAMTTNGHLFARKAAVLAKAGLTRVNFSLDTLSPRQFAELTRGG